MTQAQLAKQAGMNKTYLVRIESGDKNVTLKTAQKVAEDNSINYIENAPTYSTPIIPFVSISSVITC
ncbi:MAG: helix-turn-helix transcriptional regulator [Chloroflexota bacterium]